MAKVLVVDDSLFMRMQLANILEAGGHQVVQASSGRAGLDLLVSESPDCVILDMLMPGMDGPQFLEALSALGSSVPVIVHTADIQDSTRRECLALGAKFFLNKPPQKEQLLAAVTQLTGA